jgi:hypothetical protein
VAFTSPGSSFRVLAQLLVAVLPQAGVLDAVLAGVLSRDPLVLMGVGEAVLAG